jgi:hypothetical protein
MKFFFTTLLIVTGLYTISFAQDKNKVELGVDVGYNNSYVSTGSSNVHSATVSGFNIGVAADYYFSDRWSLKVKAIYDQKGWGDGFLTDANGNETNSVSFKLNYITVPVMANWHFGRSRNWYLNFGPYLGFLTSAKETADNHDVTSYFNSVDAGIALGIGIKIPINDKTKFFIEYDGQGGVSNIFKYTSDGSSLQNVRESFNIGINF